ncbi:MAG: hypothetical protein GX677_06475 [Treponema sp.]|nr:hypothetical protein [Treponema sp.]
MKTSGNLSYTFRKYPAIRALIVGFLIICGILVFVIVNNKNRIIPEIDSLTPVVGAPGDVVVIKGKNFGNVRDMNYVEIAGSKLTASSYISWSDTSITIVLPANVQNGLVFVGNKYEKSEPTLFANEVNIPVLVPAVNQVIKPIITSISSDRISVGRTLTIIGNNFGDSKGQSNVLFTIDYSNFENNRVIPKNNLIENMVAVSESENGYEYWSNTEIRVRIPDGACSGVVLVDTGKEKSDPKSIQIDSQVGKKSFLTKKTYLVQYSADIDSIKVKESANITFRCPLPLITATQPSVMSTEITPSPILENYQNDIIHQTSLNGNENDKKFVYTQTFVVVAYELNSKINQDKVSSYKSTSDKIISSYTKADELVPSDNSEVLSLVNEIVKKEQNPYIKAKLIYNYFCNNFEILNRTRNNDSSPLDLLKNKKGDAYDFSVMYTACLRACGIPSVTDSGILVDKDMKTSTHWWCEFYLQDYGWVPVDVALGKGLNYEEWENDIDSMTYYFGNLDSHHILFSKGWNQLKPFSQDNKIVQYPRSFALQSIWEESSSSVQKYSSYWSVPVIKGIY